MANNNWTREQLVMAFHLYCRISFGQQHKTTPAVIELAKIIGRTPDAVAMKLGNFTFLDPEMKASGRKGLSKVSTLDKVIFPQFLSDPEKYVLEGEQLFAKHARKNLEKTHLTKFEQKNLTGEGKKRLVNVRVNQYVFRSQILAAYDSRCCISGFNHPSLLIAAHIRPWAQDKEQRLNFRNGLCLNALFDKAFENGLVAIDKNYILHISSVLLKQESTSAFFKSYSKTKINLPDRNFPDPLLLEEHLQTRFVA